MNRAATGKILAAVLVLAIVVAAVVWWRERVGAERLSEQQMAELQVAVAELENQQYEAATQRLERLARALPHRRDVVLNHAIAALLAAGPDQIDRTREPDRFAAALKRAREAIARLESIAQGEPLVALLKAKLAQLEGDDAAAVQQLRSAVEQFPQSVTLNAELYVAARRAAGPEMQAVARQTLQRAFTQQPENLFLLSELLVQQASDRDPALAQTLRQAKPVLEPLAAALKQVRRVDLLELVAEAERAVEQQQWATAARNARVIANLLRPEVATLIDRRRVVRHLLEYVAVPAPDAATSADTAPPQIRVKFVPRTSWRAMVAEEGTGKGSDADAREPKPPEKASRRPSAAVAPRVCTADFDLDGVPEIVLSFGRRVQVLRRQTNAEWEELWRRSVGREVRGLVACDLDRDVARPPVAGGSQPERDSPTQKDKSAANDHERLARAAPGCVDAVPEIVLWTDSGVTILHVPEDGEGAFVPWPQQDHGLHALSGVREVVPADIDHDGDLDLVVATSDRTMFWLNREDGTFTDASERSGPPEKLKGVRSLKQVDWDRNVAMDFLAIDARSRLTWLENILHTRFRVRPPIEPGRLAPSADPSASVVQSFAIIEADGNPSWDIAVATPDGIELWTTSNPDAGRMTFRNVRRIDEFLADGLVDLDYDNDSYVDLIAWSAERVLLLRGLPGGRFERSGIEPVRGAAGAGGGPIHRCVVCDVDRDGDDDLLVVRGPDPAAVEPAGDGSSDRAATRSTGAVDLLENEGGNANPWVEIVPRADPDRRPQQPSMRVNVHALGSLIECRTPRRYQARVVRGPSVRFGLDDDPDVTSIRVLWTNGVPQHVLRPAPRQPVCAQQVLKGSCPYLYAWNGQRFVFVTDCLWAAPVGLQAAEGQYVPARNWEYLLVPGDALAARDGRYEVRLTEELWEAAYFDHVRLLIVDHPADSEVLSNEKVGPADIAQFKIHAIRRRVRPVRAVNHAGRDLLAELIDADDRYARPFDRVLRQGVTEPYAIELEFPEVGPQPVRLILTAWMKPTDTSINLALSQQSRIRPPQLPTLWLPDARGQWRPADCALGFPGGKTKTIVCDISGALREHHRAGPLRLQLRASMQMYWDQIALAVGEDDVPVRVRAVPVLHADLHYRGFSERIEHPHNGPDRYDYSRCSPGPRWPPMLGHATRYGPVTDLLRQEDGRCVVLASGDELAVTFAAPDPPPAGWRRDFLLHNVGWDKDADLNTLFGQTIDPMPDRNLSAYAADLQTLLGASTPRIGTDRSERRTRPIPRAPFWRMMVPGWLNPQPRAAR